MPGIQPATILDFTGRISLAVYPGTQPFFSQSVENSGDPEAFLCRPETIPRQMKWVGSMDVSEEPDCCLRKY